MKAIRCENTIARALGGPIWRLHKENIAYGTGYDLRHKDGDASIVLLDLMDGPSSTGKVITTLEAKCEDLRDNWFVERIVRQLENQIFELQG